MPQDAAPWQFHFSSKKKSDNDPWLSRYLQLGCDLRDLDSLERMVSGTVNVQESVILLIAEVSITYMDVEAADDLIRWAGNLSHGKHLLCRVPSSYSQPPARFCLLEQLLPQGIGHPFAETMLAHFDKLQTPLRAVEKYPSTTHQLERFRCLGWPNISVCSLWELWSSAPFASLSERKELDKIEPFDEWEEFALFGCHYFLLVADTVSVSSQTLGPKSRTRRDQSTFSESSEGVLQFQLSYEESPRAQGSNRFAAAMHISRQKSSQDAIAVFGGMGSTTRVNSLDVYTTDKEPSFPFRLDGASNVPSSRMCHTITDIGDEGALLVGGRTSPDNALADCWVFHKW